MFHNIQPVVLSGGTGSRLWPLSRQAQPKQFIPLVNNKSLFLTTLERVSVRYGFTPPLIVANQQHRFLIEEELDKGNISAEEIILEPQAKNTAPAVLVATLRAFQERPDSLLLFLPADHLIQDLPAFHIAIQEAKVKAEEGHFVCFGIKPDYAETGYGYILKAHALGENIYSVSKFTEKPSKEKAEAFLKGGNYFWNSGMFLFSAKAAVQAFEKLDPDMLHLAELALKKSYSDLNFTRLNEAHFSKIKAESIDYALMEKVDTAAIVPTSLGWTDLGSYRALWRNSVQDQNNVATVGDVYTEDCLSSYIHSEHGHVAALGLKDIAVVNTADATLVINLKKDQNVKRLVEHLSQNKRKEVENTTVIHRPWGSFESLAASDRYQVKEIIVKPGKRLSLQSHNHRAEHWVVVSGTATVIRDDEEHLLSEDQSIYLPLGCKHRLENRGNLPLKLIEVQTGAYLGEDDIIRYEDDYKRNLTD